MGVHTAGLFIETGRVAGTLIADPTVAAMWSEPAVLPGYTVGGLAAHLGRAVTTVETYLDRDPPGSETPPVEASQYFFAALKDHDPITSDLHTGIRQRAAVLAADGPAAVEAHIAETLERLARHDLSSTRRLAVFDSMAMQLSEYLKTRIVELAVHSSDLARSVSLAEPAISEEAWRVVADVSIGVALLRHGPRLVALGLTRSDAFPTPKPF